MGAQQELVVAEQELKRAQEAIAAEQREKDKTALREAITRGRELRAEYERVSGEFKAARDKTDTMEVTLKNLNDRGAELRTQEPYTNDVLASEAEQARWEKDCRRVAREHTAVCDEHRIQVALRESLRMDAIKAGHALDHQTQVVRNLKQKIEDPNGDIMRKGWEGGVFVPLGKRVSL